MIVQIYTHSEDLPKMQYTNFFHSKELMQICESTPHHKPCMAVAFENDIVIGHMLCIKRNGKCRIYGEGDFEQKCNKEQVFDTLLAAIANKQSFPSSLYIEVSDLNRKMFAYKYLRRRKFFPIHWLQVHNSLHSHSPQERIDGKILRQVAYSRKQRVTTSIVSNKEELNDFYRILRAYYNFHLRKFCPQKSFFARLMESDNGTLFLTTYHGRPIAACAIVYTKNNEEQAKDAYLWFGAYKTKSHPRLQPDIITIWNVLNWCHQKEIYHFHFMEVGLPFFKNTYYDFILHFGGKSVGTYRWFHFFPKILNRLLIYIFR